MVDKSQSGIFPRGEDGAERILEHIIPVVRDFVRNEKVPSVSEIANRTKSPFKVLISTVISARTKDKVTREASERLFSVADNPASMSGLREEEIAELIYPAGFYRNKSRSIRGLSEVILKKYDGRVPDTIEDLLKLPGVGRKTANLVVTRGFQKAGICVDTHVHRICNRLGVVRTKTPDETEFALRKVLPRYFWIEINDLLVKFGKKICTPQSPRCSICQIQVVCLREGVIKSR